MCVYYYPYIYGYFMEILHWVVEEKFDIYDIRTGEISGEHIDIVWWVWRWHTHVAMVWEKMSRELIGLGLLAKI